MKRRTEITIEIERQVIITQRRNGQSWCINCGKQVQMLTAGEAAKVMKTDDTVIYTLAESGKLHFTTTTDGMLLVCPDSLLALQSDEHVWPSPKLLITEGEVSTD